MRALLAAKSIGVLDACRLTMRGAQEATGAAAADFPGFAVPGWGG